MGSNVLSPPPSKDQSPRIGISFFCTFFFRHPRTTMSWQSYVDDQLISTNMIKNAVIAGHDGNIWASSSWFNVTAAELKVILDRYSSTDQLAINGVTVGGRSTCSSQPTTGWFAPGRASRASTASRLCKP